MGISPAHQPALVVLFLISLIGAYGLGFLFAGVA
jgi:hypothetical protein